MSNIIRYSSKRKTSNIQSNGKSHLDEIIPQSIQQQLLPNWNTPLPPAFFGAHISNCTFNINVYNSSPTRCNKRRRIFIEEE